MLIRAYLSRASEDEPRSSSGFGIREVMLHNSLHATNHKQRDCQHRRGVEDVDRLHRLQAYRMSPRACARVRPVEGPLEAQEPYSRQHHIWLPSTLWQWIGEEAKKAGISNSAFIRLVLLNFRAEANPIYERRRHDEP